MPDMNPNNLPDDVETLKALLLASQQALDITREQSTAKISELSAKNEKLAHSLLAKSQQLAVLEQQLSALRRARFGKSSEKLDVSIYQMELMIEDLESTVAELGPETSPELKKKTKISKRPPVVTRIIAKRNTDTRIGKLLRRLRPYVVPNWRGRQRAAGIQARIIPCNTPCAS